MSLVCIGIVFVVEQFKRDPKETVIENNEGFLVQAINEESNLNVLQPVSVQEVAQSEPVSSEQEVLGSGVLSCGDNAIYIESELICTQSGSGSFDMKNEKRVGTLVRRDSDITLTRATVPLELFSGMEVADSNRKITTKTPTFKAAGEQIDDISANVQLPPGEQIDTYKDSSEDIPFKTDYEIKRASNSELVEEAKIGVSTKFDNKCDPEVYKPKSNVTPTKSNGRAELMVGEYRYPNEVVAKETQDIQPCDNSKDKFIPWDDAEDACQADFVTKTVAFVKSFLDFQWLNCLIDKDSCMYVEDIVLIMASPFGTTKDCYEKGICTNAYMQKRNSIAQAPTVKSSGKTYYTTDCDVIIAGLGHATVKCAWDMTHLYKELEVSKYDDAPNVESTPSPASYNNFLQKEIKGKMGDRIPL